MKNFKELLRTYFKYIVNSVNKLGINFDMYRNVQKPQQIILISKLEIIEYFSSCIKSIIAHNRNHNLSFHIIYEHSENHINALNQIIDKLKIYPNLEFSLYNINNNSKLIKLLKDKSIDYQIDLMKLYIPELKLKSKALFISSDSICNDDFSEYFIYKKDLDYVVASSINFEEDLVNSRDLIKEYQINHNVMLIDFDKLYKVKDIDNSNIAIKSLNYHVLYKPNNLTDKLNSFDHKKHIDSFINSLNNYFINYKNIFAKGSSNWIDNFIDYNFVNMKNSVNKFININYFNRIKFLPDNFCVSVYGLYVAYKKLLQICHFGSLPYYCTKLIENKIHKKSKKTCFITYDGFNIKPWKINNDICFEALYNFYENIELDEVRSHSIDSYNRLFIQVCTTSRVGNFMLKNIGAGHRLKAYYRFVKLYDNYKGNTYIVSSNKFEKSIIVKTKQINEFIEENKNKGINNLIIHNNLPNRKMSFSYYLYDNNKLVKVNNSLDQEYKELIRFLNTKISSLQLPPQITFNLINKFRRF